jgi:hypothetical protein
LNVDENIVYITMMKEVNLSILHHKEEKEVAKLFHIKIQVKKTKVNALFNYGSQANVIVEDVVNKIGLEVRDHPNPHPLGLVNKDAKLNVNKQCKIKFSISAN